MEPITGLSGPFNQCETNFCVSGNNGFCRVDKFQSPRNDGDSGAAILASDREPVFKACKRLGSTMCVPLWIGTEWR